MKYKIGDIVELGNTLPLQTVHSRLAEVIEVKENFVVCKSLKGGYLECITTNNGERVNIACDLAMAN